MRWYKTLNSILRKEPETWLAYLHGQQLENMPVLLRNKPRYRGMLFALLRFLRHLLWSLRIRKVIVTPDDCHFFIFYGSDNQKNSLEETVKELRKKGANVAEFSSLKLNIDDDYNKVNPFFYSPVDVLRALCLLFIKGPALYRKLKKNLAVEPDRYFAKFCASYSYLCAFYRVLSSTCPDFVITANDHNLPNRCMLAVAHHLKIKSVYLQHASVSNLFPPLRVNYAFLDGQFALDIYSECEKNSAPNVSNYPIPLVILTGQKKYLSKKAKMLSEAIGIALNPMDDVDCAIDVANYLLTNGFEIKIRCHPGQREKDIQKLRAVLFDSSKVTFSDTRNESVSSFMEQIHWMLAGNSSIHLEAALVGVKPLYFEFGPPDFPDYYGYVKHGVSKKVESIEEIVAILKNEVRWDGPRAEAVRYYSATYLTQWDGREGRLVADCLYTVLEGSGLPTSVIEFVPKQLKNHSSISIK